MFDTFNAATLPTFFNGLPFELKQVAVARTAGADTEEIARWLNTDVAIIAHREAQIATKFYAFIAA